MIAQSIIFLTAWLFILTIVAGNTYDPSKDYKTLLANRDKEVLEQTYKTSNAHLDAARLHRYYHSSGYKKHKEAGQAHIRKAKWFKAKGEKHSKKQGDRDSWSNEHAFRIYNVTHNVTQAYLAKCRSSAEFTNHMVAAHLNRAWKITNHDEAQNHRQIALEGAPYSKWPSCGV